MSVFKNSKKEAQIIRTERLDMSYNTSNKVGTAMFKESIENVNRIGQVIVDAINDILRIIEEILRILLLIFGVETTQDETNILIVGTQLNDQTLSKINYTGSTLRNVNFSNSTLKGINFTDATLNNGTSFAGSTLENINFSNAVIDTIDFTNATLINVTFKNADLTGSKFKGASMSGSDIRPSQIESLDKDLSGVVLRSANDFGSKEKLVDILLRNPLKPTTIQRGSNFDGFDLTGADFSYSVLTDVKFQGAIMKDVIIEKYEFGNAFHWKFTKSFHDVLETDKFQGIANNDLRGANFGRENNSKLSSLRYMNLSGLDMTGINLSYQDLSHADLSNSNLTNANLTGANISGANLTGAIIEGTITDGLINYRPVPPNNSWFDDVTDFVTNVAGGILNTISDVVELLELDHLVEPTFSLIKGLEYLAGWYLENGPLGLALNQIGAGSLIDAMKDGLNNYLENNVYNSHNFVMLIATTAATWTAPAGFVARQVVGTVALESLKEGGLIRDTLFTDLANNSQDTVTNFESLKGEYPFQDIIVCVFEKDSYGGKMAIINKTVTKDTLPNINNILDSDGYSWDAENNIKSIMAFVKPGIEIQIRLKKQIYGNTTETYDTKYVNSTGSYYPIIIGDIKEIEIDII